MEQVRRYENYTKENYTMGVEVKLEQIQEQIKLDEAQRHADEVQKNMYGGVTTITTIGR